MTIGLDRNSIPTAIQAPSNTTHTFPTQAINMVAGGCGPPLKVIIPNIGKPIVEEVMRQPGAATPFPHSTTSIDSFTLLTTADMSPSMLAHLVRVEARSPWGEELDTIQETPASLYADHWSSESSPEAMPFMPLTRSQEGFRPLEIPTFSPYSLGAWLESNSTGPEPFKPEDSETSDMYGDDHQWLDHDLCEDPEEYEADSANIFVKNSDVAQIFSSTDGAKALYLPMFFELSPAIERQIDELLASLNMSEDDDECTPLLLRDTSVESSPESSRRPSILLIHLEIAEHLEQQAIMDHKAEAGALKDATPGLEYVSPSGSSMEFPSLTPSEILFGEHSQFPQTVYMPVPAEFLGFVPLVSDDSSFDLDERRKERNVLELGDLDDSFDVDDFNRELDILRAQSLEARMLKEAEANDKIELFNRVVEGLHARGLNTHISTEAEVENNTKRWRNVASLESQMLNDAEAQNNKLLDTQTPPALPPRALFAAPAVIAKAVPQAPWSQPKPVTVDWSQLKPGMWHAMRMNCLPDESTDQETFNPGPSDLWIDECFSTEPQSLDEDEMTYPAVMQRQADEVQRVWAENEEIAPGQKPIDWKNFFVRYRRWAERSKLRSLEAEQADAEQHPPQGNASGPAPKSPQTKPAGIGSHAWERQMSSSSSQIWVNTWPLEPTTQGHKKKLASWSPKPIAQVSGPAPAVPNDKNVSSQSNTCSTSSAPSSPSSDDPSSSSSSGGVSLETTTLTNSDTANSSSTLSPSPSTKYNALEAFNAELDACNAQARACDERWKDSAKDFILAELKERILELERLEASLNTAINALSAIHIQIQETLDQYIRCLAASIVYDDADGADVLMRKMLGVRDVLERLWREGMETLATRDSARPLLSQELIDNVNAVAKQWEYQLVKLLPLMAGWMEMGVDGVVAEMAVVMLGEWAGEFVGVSR